MFLGGVLPVSLLEVGEGHANGTESYFRLLVREKEGEKAEGGEWGGSGQGDCTIRGKFVDSGSDFVAQALVEGHDSHAGAVVHHDLVASG